MGRDVVQERCVAFVVVRLNSSRFQQKQLQYIGDRRIIDWTLEAVKASQAIDEVVIATVDEAANHPLTAVAEQHQVSMFWYQGATDDVVGRLRQAAEQYQADICVMVSGDCPLLDAATIDQVVAALRESSAAEVVKLSAPPLSEADVEPSVANVPLLEGVLVSRISAWRRGDALSLSAAQREHQFPIFYQQPAQFQFLSVPLSTAVCGPKQRLSVDTPADLAFMRAVWQALIATQRTFSLPAAIALLREQPQLRAINAHVHQRQLEESGYRVLLQSTGELAPKVLQQHLAVAHDLVERCGWVVTLLVDERSVLEQLKGSRVGICWGGGVEEGVPPEPVMSDYHLVVRVALDASTQP